MNDGNDLVLPKMYAQILCHFDAIQHHAVQRHRRRNRLDRFSQGSTRTPLVPLRYREILFPRSEQRERPRVAYIAGAPMQKQQDGFCMILAANKVTQCSMPGSKRN